MTNNPPIREMVKQSVAELGGRATNTQIRDAILARFPTVNTGSIYAQIAISSVNSPSRVHYPENLRPRIASDPRYDFLYRVGRGQVEFYDPARHGIWEILRDADGRLHVAVSEEGPAEELAPAPEEGYEGEAESVPTQFLFSLERQLRDFLAANIGSLGITDAPLSVYVDEAGQSGVEYPTGVGPVDILAVDARGDFVVFELKLGRGPDAAVGQLARYMGWTKRHLAGEHAVRGVIVARTVNEKLRYAASIMPNVSLFEYTMSFTLAAADEVRQP
jgi:RecB family endonuclease NucS